jgi:hypothetical protein
MADDELLEAMAAAIEQARWEEPSHPDEVDNLALQLARAALDGARRHLAEHGPFSDEEMNKDWWVQGE